MPKIKSHKETRKKALSHVLDIINLQRKKIKVIKQIELDQLTVAYSRVEFRYRNYVTKQLKTKIREYTHLFIPKTFNKESVRGEIFAEVFIDDGVLKNNHIGTRVNKSGNAKDKKHWGTLKYEHLESLRPASPRDYPFFVNASYMSPRFKEEFEKPLFRGSN